MSGRLSAGSIELARAYRSWLFPGWKPRELGATVLRLAGQAGATAALLPTIVAPHPWVLAGAPCLWCAAALAIGGRDGAELDEDQEDDEVEPDPITQDEFIQVVLDEIGGGSGVHLAALADRLADIEPGIVWDTAAVRELAGEFGIPITPSVRSGGRVSTGIHLKDVPPPPLSEPPVASSSAGQPATATATRLTSEVHGEGMWIYRHPADAARHHTITQRRPAR